MLKNSTILILGAQGMLGQEIMLQAGQWTKEAVGWDQKELDLTDFLVVEKKIVNLQPHFIINCAAYNNVDRAENEDCELAMKINGEAVGYLAEVADRIGAVFVHYSTDYVFCGDKKEGYKENEVPKPQSWYAKSKYEGERQIINFKCHPELVSGSQSLSSKEMLKSCHRQIRHGGQVQHDKLKYYLIRTSRLFGPAGTGQGAKKSFVDKMLELGRVSCHSREACPRATSESGNPDVGLDLIDEEVSSPTYVVDLARAIFELIESKAPWGIYHRTNAGACTWYGWAQKIFELAGMSVKLNSVPASRFPRPAVRPKFSQLLTTKLPPLRKWEEALGEYLKIFKNI